MLNVPFGSHVLLAVIIELKNVFVTSHFLFFFSNDVPLQVLVSNFLFGHRAPVFEAPVPRTHVIVFVVGVGSVFQRIFQHGSHFMVGV